MHLELAKPSDSDRLKEFFGQTVLPGAVDVYIDRPGDFFDQYRLQSDDFETYVLRDGDNQIKGLASLIFREAVLNAERQTIAYATDLRIAPTRLAVVQWSQHFLPVLERALETRGCRYVFSAIQTHDHQAINALIRPQHVRRRLPRYYLLRRFHIVAVHGKAPFAKKPLSQISLEPLHLNSLSEFCAFMRTTARHMPFSWTYDEESFLARLRRWPGLELEDFQIARDTRKKILGCAALWSPSEVQQIIPARYHGFAETIRQLVKVAGWSRLINSLPRPGQAFPFRFLTHLRVASPEVFHRLLDDARSRCRPRELLAYGHFRGNLVTLPPRGTIVTALPYSLYTVLPPQADLPEFLQADPWNPPPEFEIAWL